MTICKQDKKHSESSNDGLIETINNTQLYKKEDENRKLLAKLAIQTTALQKGETTIKV